MEFNNTNIEVKEIKNYDLSDETKLIFIDVDTDEPIGYIIFTEECFPESYTENYDGKEVCEIVDEYEPMSIDYLEVFDEYKGEGFGKFILQYTLDNYIQDKSCLLLKSAYNVINKDIANNMLDAFYTKFGFKHIPNSNYMFKM